MKHLKSIKSRLAFRFILITLSTILLAAIAIPRYLDYIVKETFFQTIEKTPQRLEPGPPTSDVYAVQHLIIGGNGLLLTNRGDIKSLLFFNDDFLQQLTRSAIAQTSDYGRYVLTLDNSKAYVVIRKNGQIFMVDYLFDIYGKQFSVKLVLSTILLLLVLALFGFLIMFYFSEKLASRIIRLRNKVTSIASGTLTAPIEADNDDEVGDLEQTFEQMRVQLLSKEKLNNEMLQNISHELKTPIMVIKTYAQAVKDGIYPEGELDGSLNIIMSESDKLDAKVQKILLLNKIKYLKDHSEPLKPVQIKALIESLVKRFENISQLHYELALDEIVFMGDEEKWTIVLENILSNNLRYARSTINIELTEGQLSVENDGPQIEFEDPQEVFMAFRKGHSGKNGIGLEITRAIVELFGYAITAKNTLEGVRFVIRVNK